MANIRNNVCVGVTHTQIDTSKYSYSLFTHFLGMCVCSYELHTAFIDTPNYLLRKNTIWRNE